MSVVGAYGPWLERCLAGWERPFSFLRDRWERIGPWRAEARAVTLGLLAAPQTAPEAVTAGAEVRDSYALDGLQIDEMLWRLPYGPPTEALFIRPSGARGPLPAVLGLHDHGGVKYYGKAKICRTGRPLHPFLAGHQREYYGGVGWANELARRGFAVLVHDVFAFESRRVLAPQRQREMGPEDLRDPVPVTDYDVSNTAPPAAGPESSERIQAYNAFGGAHEDIMAKALFSAGLTWPGVTLAEDQVALGVLCARPEVDPSRVGCCGLSGGGLRSCFLAGLDERVRCSVTAGFMTTWRDFALATCYTHTWMLYVPHLSRHMDFPDILAMHAPSPALVLATDQDPLFTLEETLRAADHLGKVYAKAAANGAFRFSLHSGPHKFDLPMQEEAFAWLQRWLAPQRPPQARGGQPGAGPPPA
jgi:dienelactone hydrolase